MALAPGTRLGPYEIAAQIGVGGMGVVYRATDTNLKRPVAIKVLPDALASDAERLARFQREAEVLASLNHPNIASIYGLERTDTTTALVLELVEGPTLADRIAQGPIPLDEALPIARQVAEALEAAHEQGIIHRDLKPANVKLRPDGVVKVLDFGLAKALEPVSAGSTDATASPTITSPAMMTRVGVILGTAAYMSPEQARGLALDTRTDIWSFGCVLYEMLSGEPAFQADDVSDTLALVLTKDAPWEKLPSNTPALVRRLLRRMLTKDRKMRLAAMQDARIELDEVLREPANDRTSSTRPGFRTAVIGAAVVAIGALGAVAAFRALESGRASASVTRLSVLLPDDISLAPPGHIAISPDGQTVAFVGGDPTVRSRLYVRRLDELEPRPLAGTENAMNPFFSPDGQWIAFFDLDHSDLKKVPVRGGTSEVLCRGCTTRAIGGCWGSNGWIIIAAWPKLGLWRVPSDGGTAEVVSKPPDNTWFMWPTLVGDHAVLFTTWRDGRTAIDALSFTNGERREIIASGSHPRYVASGHLVYSSEGQLFAVPFDPARLEVHGVSRLVVDGVASDVLAVPFDVSLSGTLAYVAGSALSQVAWRSRDGQTQSITERDRLYSLPAISPDGTRLAVTIREGITRNVWVGTLGHSPLARLTFGNDDVYALWTPDGERIIFTSGQGGRYDLFWTPFDGSGRPERLTDTPDPKKPTSLSSSGKLLLFNVSSPSTVMDIWQMALNGKEPPRPYLQTRFNEGEGGFSPDGRWVAYMSDETGRYEVYVQSYPGPGGKKRVSIDGGTGPAWNPNGRELFYQTWDALMSVSISREGQALRVGAPVRLFAHERDPLLMGRGRDYSVSRDGLRFLVTETTDIANRSSQRLHVVVHWFEELNARLPKK